MNTTYSLIIHGGCGRVANKDKYDVSLKKILEAGRKMLFEGKSALDTVEHCVNLLEDDPLFNAGKGSVLNEKGDIDCDAAIMDGKDMTAGSVSVVQGIKNPISCARLVKERSGHVMLVGSGAMEFAKIQNVEMRPQEYFVVPERVAQLRDAQFRDEVTLDHNKSTEDKKGTVGAVARDMKGNVAAATSTGGTVNKKFGRVGDSPIIGAGVYADNATGATSCTGIGEHFLRTSLAKEIDFYLRKDTATAKGAAKEGIGYLVQKVNGLGGVIVVDKNGICGVAHSTESMIAGYIEHGGDIVIV